jgi:hypothetical protein
MWSHKSGIHRLPYHDDLLVPHHIDFMHTEKNIAEALFTHSWTSISLRITLRTKWTLQHYVIDQSRDEASRRPQEMEKTQGRLCIVH